MQVEQLHKIFKLCGSPPDDFWKKSKLPLASMFKPSHPYESTLRERCKEFPKSAVSLLETFLSIETYKRGTASSALESEVLLLWIISLTRLYKTSAIMSKHNVFQFMNLCKVRFFSPIPIYLTVHTLHNMT